MVWRKSTRETKRKKRMEGIASLWRKNVWRYLDKKIKKKKKIALCKGPITRRISQNFLHTCHSSSILLCISSKNMWRICEEYVTVYCLKFYVILNKFESVWIYPKLWRILNNRMALYAIKIWNLNRFEGTYKHENERKKMDSQGYYHEMQNGCLFRQMQLEKIQHENP